MDGRVGDMVGTTLVGRWLDPASAAAHRFSETAQPHALSAGRHCGNPLQVRSSVIAVQPQQAGRACLRDEAKVGLERGSIVPPELHDWPDARVGRRCCVPGAAHGQCSLAILVVREQSKDVLQQLRVERLRRDA